MAELTPLFMDINNAYSGDELGLPLRDLIGEGILAAGDLAVSAGAGNSVNVAAGACYVLGDTNVNAQPCYRCRNDAVVNKGISPDPSNPRRVLIVAQITDETFAGSGRNWTIAALHGAPAGAPVAPALPASALPLAEILVPAGAASSAAYTFTDLRVRASVGTGGLMGIAPVGGPQRIARGTAILSFANSITSANPAPDIAHGLGVVPACVVATSMDTHVVVLEQSGARTATNFRLIGRMADGVAFNGNASVNWIALT